MIFSLETYNILSRNMSDPNYFINHDPKYLDWEYRTRAICEKIRGKIHVNCEDVNNDNNNNSAAQLHVFCLQEVQKKQHAIIKQLLDDEFHIHYRSYGGSMGVVILWNKSFIDETSKCYEYKYDEKRGNIVIGVDFSKFSVWTIHLPCMYGVENASEARTELMKNTLDKIREMVEPDDSEEGGNEGGNKNKSKNRCGRPMILAGDFNSSPGGHTYTFLSETLSFTSAYKSFHGAEPVYTNIFTGKDGVSGFSTCDYIFTSPGDFTVKSMNKTEMVGGVEFDSTPGDDDTGRFIIPNADFLSDHVSISGVFYIS